MSDYICPYNCSYRTNSGFCGYTGGYDACQYRRLNHEENTVVGYVPPLKLTNADRIRAMSVEELAKYMGDVQTWGGCPNHGARNCQEDCSKCWLDWLKEASDG